MILLKIPWLRKALLNPGPSEFNAQVLTTWPRRHLHFLLKQRRYIRHFHFKYSYLYIQLY